MAFVGGEVGASASPVATASVPAPSGGDSGIPSITNVGDFLGGAGAILGGVGSILQARQEVEIGEANAKAILETIKTKRAATAARIRDLTRQAGYIQGTQTAIRAYGGVSVNTGSALNAILSVSRSLGRAKAREFLNLSEAIRVAEYQAQVATFNAGQRSAAAQGAAIQGLTSGIVGLSSGVGAFG